MGWRAQAEQLWSMGWLARGVWAFSSWTWGWTPVPYIGRQTLNHWTTREVPHLTHFSFFFKYSIACTNRILYVHSSIDRPLGCFYLLAIVHSTDINMDVQICFKTLLLILLDVYLESICMPGSHGNSVLNFWGTAILFLTAVAHLPNPINSAQGFQLLGIPTNAGDFLFVFVVVSRHSVLLNFNRIF